MRASVSAWGAAAQAFVYSADRERLNRLGPTLAAKDIANLRFAHAVLCRERPLRHRFGILKYLGELILCYPGVRVAVSGKTRGARPSPFLDHIV
jgi:hypothetical protein